MTQKEIYDRRRHEGLCIKCGKEPEAGKKNCRSCLDRAALASSKARALRKENGKCPSCARSLDSKHHLEICAKRHKNLRDARRNLGLCTSCGESRDSELMWCSSCLQPLRVRRDLCKIQVFSHFNEVCFCCGEDTKEFLQIDHIDGGGHKHRKEVGNDIYLWLVENAFPDGFQLLCANCNVGKRLNKGICPKHKKVLGRI